VYRSMVAATLRFVYRRAFAGDDSWMMRATAADVSFRFPGTSSFAASTEGRESLRAWVAQFAALGPSFDVRDVAVSGGDGYAASRCSSTPSG